MERRKHKGKTGRRLGASLLAAGLLTGCGQFKYPEATIPPEWAPLGERAPAFTVFTEDPLLAGQLTEIHSKDFRGHVLVAVGASPGFVGELLPWLGILKEHYGPPRDLAFSGGAEEPTAGSAGRYSVLLVVERAGLSAVRKLRPVMPEGLTVLMDPAGEFANALETEQNRFGFVGEGPHIAVISADGTLLALIDGPVSEKRRDRLVEAMDRAFSLLEEDSGRD